MERVPISVEVGMTFINVSMLNDYFSIDLVYDGNGFIWQFLKKNPYFKQKT
jgi:hypothetical protein